MSTTMTSCTTSVSSARHCNSSTAPEQPQHEQQQRPQRRQQLLPWQLLPLHTAAAAVVQEGCTQAPIAQVQ